LTEGARRLQGGELSHRIEVPGRRDEVGELAAAFNAMAASLERTDELRRDLVNDVAHELRTPLTRLQGQVEAVIDGLAPASPERLRSLHADTLLLGRLIRDLEDLARAEAGRLCLHQEPVNVAEILGAAAEAFSHLPGARLRLDLPSALPRAHCDAQRLRQMVDNLLTNARTHTPADGEIVVEAREEGEEIEIAVRDSGPGLAPEERERVFERFVRGDPSRQRVTGGAGLGLAIVAQLARAQGGRAWVESEPGQGARFAFRLPRA
jgi:signal transduction histidine kinase